MKDKLEWKCEIHYDENGVRDGYKLKIVKVKDKNEIAMENLLKNIQEIKDKNDEKSK